MSKIGIMGGTFDPIHRAHLQMARCAMQQKKLDKVLFMPSKIPPHKMGQPISDERLRARLVKLAVEEEEGFYYSDFELRREEVTYTAKTLALLKEQHPKDQFYFIMGGDSLFQFAHWYQPEEIVKYAVVLAVSRGNVAMQQMEEQAAWLSQTFHGTFELVTMEKLNISSSLIRERLLAGKSVKGMLPQKVYEYIQQNHCYTNVS
jgi:nicotinate-nucleotide adenylyltransferase